MKYLFALSYFGLVSAASFAQAGQNSIAKTSDIEKYVLSHTIYKTRKDNKSALDFEAIKTWRSLGDDRDLSISPDGKFFAYSVKKSHMDEKADSLVVQPIQGNWRQAFAEASAGFFSADSRQYIFQSKDELNFLKTDHSITDKSITDKVNGVSSYQLSASQDWVAYLLKDKDAFLVLKNLLTGMEKRFGLVSGFAFDKSGSWLIFKLKNENRDLVLYSLATGKEVHVSEALDYKFNDGGETLIVKSIQKATQMLLYVNLLNGEKKTIWSSGDTAFSINNYNLDSSGNQVVFMVTDNGKHNSIWYYKDGMDKAIMKVNDQAQGIDAGLSILGEPSLTDNGNYIIFFLAKQQDNREDDPDKVELDIWSYKDTMLRTAQAQYSQQRRYSAIIKTDGVDVIRLTKEYEGIKVQKGDFALIETYSHLKNGDRYWAKGNYYNKNWLVSLKDGSRKLLPIRNCSNYQGNYIWFSPGGNYLVYFDLERGYNYFSYDLHSDKLTNISFGVSKNQLGFEGYYHHPRGQKSFRHPTYGIAAWLQDDRGVLVYDDYDIWYLDLTGKTGPINITNGYGRRQKILLALMENDRNGHAGSSVVLSSTDTLLLNAFNRGNKYNGFCRKILSKPGDPEVLNMGPYFFQIQELMSYNGFYNQGGIILKARNANTWIIKRQSVSDAPNYFITNDFKSFRRLTDFQPQKYYNWLTSELHQFRQMDGSMSQGVLYKPENFDPKKKYPVLVSFYFQHSDQLNLYPSPYLLDGPMDFENPAWFVSHGYLIFCPDIYFSDKAWGPSVVNTMEGAVRYLAGLSYVDGERIGLSGHSNSGRMGYYAITHSRSFAAMSIGTGALGPDYLSSALSFENYLSASRSTLSTAEENENSGLGMLWSNKEIWLDHTAVLQADKVTSPLLLFFNDKDSDPVTRGAELFIAFWRLEKKIWWLDYNKEGHTLNHEHEQKDYTIRYTQFFDHYLKEAPAPRWMTNGIPYKLKQIENRYELDPSGTCDLPNKKECPICKAWNRQYKRTPEMFAKPIAEWKLDDDIQKQMEKEETKRYNENMKGKAERIRENNAKLKTGVKN